MAKIKWKPFVPKIVNTNSAHQVEFTWRKTQVITHRRQFTQHLSRVMRVPNRLKVPPSESHHFQCTRVYGVNCCLYNYNGQTWSVIWLVNDVTCGCVDTMCPSVEFGSFPYQHPHFTTSKICTSAFYSWPCTCHPSSSRSNQHYTILIMELTFSVSNCIVLYCIVFVY